MATYTTLADSGFDPGKPITQAQGLALRDNPTAIAERASGAPIVQPLQYTLKTTGTAATWTIPAGVTAFTVYVIGAGGSGGSGSSEKGGDSTFVYNGVTVTGGGGYGAANSAGDDTTYGDSSGGAGGTGTGGDYNLRGLHGDRGGMPALFSSWSYGCGHINGGTGSGGGGACAVKRFAVNSGASAPVYTIGQASASANPGQNGVILIEY